MNFHFIRYLWNKLCVLYPEPLAMGYTSKTRNEFHRYLIKWKFISDSFYYMIILKISIFHEKTVYFEKIPCKNCLERSCLTWLHNDSTYDVANKEAGNWCKKCYEMGVLLENLWNGFMKGQITWKLILYRLQKLHMKARVGLDFDPIYSIIFIPSQT